jgi:molybdopterin/thiamine biosynthesis adenylyltransferase
MCAGGARSAFAAKTLGELGYADVVSMEGGFNRWKDEGRDWGKPKSLSPEQRNRYQRHLLLPELGEAGQLKLLAARVLLLGAGGLGSPAALYLAAAGVGTLGIVDMDVVDMSNLQRQILHTNDRVGMPKVESARQTLTALNPDIKVIGYQERVTSENIMALIADYDVIVDGCDNFPTRYLVNDACVMANKPNVHGSIFQFEGQATVFMPHEGPCYRCLFPEPPPPGAAPSCQEAGVLGVLPGLVGCVQALETIKLILGVGRPLIGRMVYFDTLSMELRVHKLRKDPNCPVCGEHPTITALIDYEEFCGLRAPGQAAAHP